MAVNVYTGFAPGVSLDSTRLRAAFQAAPAVLYTELRKAMVNIAAEHTKRVKKSFTAYKYGKNTGNRLQARSGDLRRAIGPPSLTGSSLGTLRMVQVVNRPANSRPYARIQELGGTVRPVQAKKLTIPLRDALDPSGILRQTARLRRVGVWARSGKPRYETQDGRPTFILRKNGKSYVVARSAVRPKKGKEEKPTALYLLVDQVTIPPRLGFREAWVGMRDYQQEALSRAVERALGGLEGR